MISPKNYLVYARAPFASASVIPVLLGASLAWRSGGRVDLVDFTLTLVGMVFAHFGINLFNDYYDFLQGADQENRFRTPLSGGSPHLVEGKERPKRIRNLAWASVCLAFACGLALMIRVDRGIGPVFWLMAAGFLGGYFYTAPPFKFCYRGWGELFIFLDFGVLPTVGAYYVLTRVLSWTPVVVSFPVGFLITNVLWVNQFPDFESDRDSGKRTLVVRLGTHRARFVYLALVVLSFLVILLTPRYLPFSRYFYLGLIGLAPAILATTILLRHHHDPPGLLKAQVLTVIAHIATGVLLSVGILL